MHPIPQFFLEFAVLAVAGIVLGRVVAGVTLPAIDWARRKIAGWREAIQAAAARELNRKRAEQQLEAAIAQATTILAQADAMATVDQMKARIYAIGDIEYDDAGGIVLLKGWGFDCTNGTPPHRVGSDGLYRYCGYTRDELIEIHARRDEFADRPRA